MPSHPALPVLHPPSVSHRSRTNQTMNLLSDDLPSRALSFLGLRRRVVNNTFLRSSSRIYGDIYGVLSRCTDLIRTALAVSLLYGHAFVRRQEISMRDA